MTVAIGHHWTVASSFNAAIVHPINLIGPTEPSLITQYYPEMTRKLDAFKMRGQFQAGQLWLYHRHGRGMGAAHQAHDPLVSGPAHRHPGGAG